MKTDQDTIIQQNKEIEDLKSRLNHSKHRVNALEAKDNGDVYFDVEYNNTTDVPDRWNIWGVSSVSLKDLEEILDFVNTRRKNNNNDYFKTIHTFRIVEKCRGVHKVKKTIKNDSCTLSWEEYIIKYNSRFQNA